MADLLDLTPLLAAGFAVPQFLPQIARLRATGDAAGVSWSWATLTSVNNAAWFGYFAQSGIRTALVPATSATVLAGSLSVMLARRGEGDVRPAAAIGVWAAALLLAQALAGRVGLGTLLSAALMVQIAPSLWAAYRSPRPTGVSASTWLLVLGELSCWTIFGIHRSDARLVVPGTTGVAASALMLLRLRLTVRSRFRPSSGAGAPVERATRAAPV